MKPNNVKFWIIIPLAIIIVIEIMWFVWLLFLKPPTLSRMDSECGQWRVYQNGVYVYPELTLEEATKCVKINQRDDERWEMKRPDRLKETKDMLKDWK